MAERRATTSGVIEAIQRERDGLLDAFDALGDRATTVSVTAEGWTAKDVLAHLIHWATQVAAGLGAQVEPPAYMLAERERRRREGLSDAMPTGDESNALAVAYFGDFSLTEVRERFERLVAAMIERARLRTDDEMNATGAVAWAPQRVLGDFIAGDTYVHWREHREAIERTARV